MAGTFKARSVRESDLYIAQRDEIEPDVKRIDDILAGLIWGMSENPGEFFNIPDTRLYIAKTDYFPFAPRLRVWFTFDDDYVELLSIERIEDEEY